MAYIIAAPCIGVKDEACVEVCPVRCIRPAGDPSEPMVYIDPDECIDCGSCEAECPVEAIFSEEDVPSRWTEFIEINAKFHELRNDPQAWAAYRRSKADLLRAPDRD